jgi:hypothetical protein
VLLLPSPALVLASGCFVRVPEPFVAPSLWLPSPSVLRLPILHFQAVSIKVKPPVQLASVGRATLACARVQLASKPTLSPYVAAVG